MKWMSGKDAAEYAGYSRDWVEHRAISEHPEEPMIPLLSHQSRMQRAGQTADVTGAGSHYCKCVRSRMTVSNSSRTAKSPHIFRICGSSDLADPTKATRRICPALMRVSAASSSPPLHGAARKVGNNRPASRRKKNSARRFAAQVSCPALQSWRITRPRRSLPLDGDRPILAPIQIFGTPPPPSPLLIGGTLNESPGAPPKRTPQSRATQT
jgi:hypothetical protein